MMRRSTVSRKAMEWICFCMKRGLERSEGDQEMEIFLNLKGISWTMPKKVSGFEELGGNRGIAVFPRD
ncbi:hypothetical protein MTR67_013862 [Solanum verrucosum]|uniref:Uncharacterized protein n=1 Tax=Solanum verrucosum TaxID=315347 RepID=A0AAF0QCP8_SOLVR|nr:hypothetical protein MTR67_013862 [Solanum verrucosum]